MKNYTKDELALILLDSYEGLEYKHKSAVISLYKNVGDLFEDPRKFIDYVKEKVGEGESLTVKGSLNSKDYLNYLIKNLADRNILAITCLSEDYPEIFANLPSKPLIIYAKGNIKLLNANKTFGIVGSRKTLPFVLKAGENIAKELSSNGIVIISGSAVGGDRCALLGALESGNVISILASGHDFVSPQSNRDLVQKISQKGLVISEYPPNVCSAPWRFPMRNRLISALSNSVLFLSGQMESGTRYTAKFAEAYSKTMYAIPYSLGEKSGEICNLLIKLGKAQLVETAEDIAESENIVLKEEIEVDLDDDEIEILSAMEGSMHVDQIALNLGKKTYEIMPILSMLEIKGVVAKGANNIYTAIIKIKQ